MLAMIRMQWALEMSLCCDLMKMAAEDSFATITKSSKDGYDMSTLSFNLVTHNLSGQYTCQAINHNTLKDTETTFMIVECELAYNIAHAQLYFSIIAICCSYPHCDY